MRKIYSTLALAALVCAGATAAEKTAVRELGLAQIQQFTTVGNIEMREAPMKSAPQRAASINDFCGYFKAEYEWFFSSKDPGTELNIAEVDATHVAITMHPWCDYSNVNMSPIIANVDVAAGTITIVAAANSNLGTVTFEGEGTFPLACKTVTWAAAADGRIQLTDAAQITGTLQANGEIVFPENTGFGFYTGDGWVGAFFSPKFVAPPYFDYVASEWESIGTASYDEYIITPLLTRPIGAVNVPLERNKADHGLFLLKNPYAQGNWAQVADRNTEGYIVFSIATPDCVWVRPLTPSGFWWDMRDEGAPNPVWEEFYMYNLEGQYVVNEEADPEEVAEVMADMVDNVSTFDATTRTAKIYNVMFGQTSNPGAGYTWTKYPDLTMTIVLPENYNAGIDGVINDAENVPARYFNLQGVEIANPEAGQVVIVKKGNEAFKTIAK